MTNMDPAKKNTTVKSENILVVVISNPARINTKKIIEFTNLDSQVISGSLSPGAALIVKSFETNFSKYEWYLNDFFLHIFITMGLLENGP